MSEGRQSGKTVLGAGCCIMPNNRRESHGNRIQKTNRKRIGYIY